MDTKPTTRSEVASSEERADDCGTAGCGADDFGHGSDQRRVQIKQPRSLIVSTISGLKIRGSRVLSPLFDAHSALLASSDDAYPA